MPDMETTIHTERLDLILMTPTFLETALRGDQAQAAHLLGMPISTDFWPLSSHVHERLAQVHHNSALAPWLGRAIVLRASQTMIGSIAFHMAAEPEPVRPLGPGGVEFGYTVFPQFRRQGYATEASRALMTWAQQQG